LTFLSSTDPIPTQLKNVSDAAENRLIASPFERHRETEIRVLLEMRSAIERVGEGKSYRSVAADTPNISRATLLNIYKDDDRRAWYLDGEAADEKVDHVLANATDRR
jgi:hypothetical protein